MVLYGGWVGSGQESIRGAGRQAERRPSEDGDGNSLSGRENAARKSHV